MTDDMDVTSPVRGSPGPPGTPYTDRTIHNKCFLKKEGENRT